RGRVVLVPSARQSAWPENPLGTTQCCRRRGEHAEQTLSCTRFSRQGPKEGVMEVVYERCGGLDGQAKTVGACLLTPGKKEIRTFVTMTAELLQLLDWLTRAGCTHVAMESTGVYWKPVFNILEGGCEVMLVNARPIKAVPGRKTDVRDCEWLADLLRHGLVKASFIPPREIREVRELTRYRQTLVKEH